MPCRSPCALRIPGRVHCGAGPGTHPAGHFAPVVRPLPGLPHPGIEMSSGWQDSSRLPRDPPWQRWPCDSSRSRRPDGRRSLGGVPCRTMRPACPVTFVMRFDRTRWLPRDSRSSRSRWRGLCRTRNYPARVAPLPSRFPAHRPACPALLARRLGRPTTERSSVHWISLS